MSKVASKVAVEEARVASLTNPDDLIGTLVWWSINEVLISREEFKARVEALNLKADRFLINSRPRSAFRRALEAAESLNLIRKIADTPESIVFGIVQENADQKKLELNYETQDVVIFSKADQTLTFKMAKADADRIREEFEKYRNSFTSHEIRTMIHAELRRSGAFPVRDKGGIYFVPTNQMEVVDQLTSLVQGLNGSYIFVMGVRNQDKEKEGMQRSWEQALAQEIKTLKSEVDATLDEGTRVREGTLTTRMASINDLKTKIEVYNKLFGGSAEVQEDLENLLQQLTAVKQAKFSDMQGKRKVKKVKKETPKEKAPERKNQEKQPESVSDINAALTQTSKPVEIKESAKESAAAE